MPTHKTPDVLQPLNNALFPTFRKFTIEDCVWYERFYRQHVAPYADFAPSDLMTWLDIDGTLEVSRIDDSVVLRYDNTFDTNDALNHVLLEVPLRTTHVKAIFRYAQQRHIAMTMNEAPAFTNKVTLGKTFIVQANRDAAEYILSMEELAKLDGRPLGTTRRAVASFLRTHEKKHIKIECYDQPGAEQQKLLTRLIKKWPLTVRPDTSGPDNREREAISLAIKYISELKTKLLVIRIGNRPVAFSLFSIYDSTAIVSHAKVDYTYKDCFDFLINVLAKELLSRNVQYMNLDQDLGLPGLRAHKMRYRPVWMLEKINITPTDLPRE